MKKPNWIPDINVNWWKVAKKGLRVWVWCFVTCGFMLFILEEGSQLLGFSRFTLMGGKLWREAEIAIQSDRVFNKFNQRVAKGAMWINPIAGYTFDRYFGAEDEKMARELMRVNAELNKLDARLTRVEKRVKTTLPPVNMAIDIAPAKKLDTKLARVLRPSRQLDYRPNPGEVTVILVYKTAYGACYHKKACGSLANAHQLFETTIKDATAEGLRQCRRCKP